VSAHFCAFWGVRAIGKDLPTAEDAPGDGDDYLISFICRLLYTRMRFSCVRDTLVEKRKEVSNNKYKYIYLYLVYTTYSFWILSGLLSFFRVIPEKTPF
jgi:hypothetical protein